MITIGIDLHKLQSQLAAGVMTVTREERRIMTSPDRSPPPFATILPRAS